MEFEQYNKHLKALDAIKEALMKQYVHANTTYREGDTIKWTERINVCGDAEYEDYRGEIARFDVDFDGTIRVVVNSIHYHPHIDEIKLVRKKINLIQLALTEK